ncbi:MAG: hypothetical protein KAS71_00780, partial [Bacteroidales bacterium]|nr:hypothetical protein [Bacteroidales bacterium]
MKKYLIILFLSIPILSSSILYSQNIVMDLYPEGEIPNYVHTDEQEIRDTTDAVWIRTVQTPD